ncbi:Neurofibromin 1 [Chytridiales sp. JEL 0842]|nr:Neurofibromin 1 [Chytridiales sp. JEL 0842]
MTTDIKVLQSLVSSISEKLPVYSGLPLSFLETDVTFNQNVKAIIELCPWRLWDVAAALVKVLDTISNAPRKPSNNEENSLPVEVLRSQLYVLRVLANCLAYYWKLYRETRDPINEDDAIRGNAPSFVNPGVVPLSNLQGPQSSSSSPPKNNYARSNVAGQYPGSPARYNSPSDGMPSQQSQQAYDSNTGSPIPKFVSDISIYQGGRASSEETMTMENMSAQMNRMNVSGNLTPSLPSGLTPQTSMDGTSSLPTATRSLSDPPPLDEGLANFIISAISRFFFTSTGHINADSISHTTFHQSLGFNISDRESYLPSNIASFFTHTQNKHYMPNSELYQYPSGSEILLELQKAAGRIVFYVSASNWAIVFSRIRHTMNVLQVTANQTDPDDVSSGDLTELRFLEWCNVNRARLATILAEMNNGFKSFTKRAQFLSAIVLRRAIWNWIETFPFEFSQLCLSQRRMEAGPDVLFSTLLSLSDQTSRRRMLFWPTQTMLLLLCPDLLSAIWLSGSKNSGLNAMASPLIPPNVIAKAQGWLDSVRKGLKGKVADVSTLCLVDLCQATTFAGKAEGGPLRFMASNLEAELKEKLFSVVLSRSGGGNSIGSGGGSTVAKDRDKDDELGADFRVVVDCLTAFFKLNPWNTLRTIISNLLDTQCPSLYKVVLVKSCLEIVSEENPLPWNPTIDASLANNMRALFLDNISRDRGADARARKFGNTDRKTRIKIVAEELDRHDIVLGILQTWCKCPLLAIAKDTSTVGQDELRSLLAGVVACLGDLNSPAIRTAAAECLRVLLDPDFIHSWDGTTPDWRHPHGPVSDTSMFSFWRTTSQVISALSHLLIEVRHEMSTPTNQELVRLLTMSLLELLCDLLKSRNIFLKRRVDIAAIGSGVPERAAAVTSLEVALLVLLCTPDTEVITHTVACIGHIVDEIELTDESISQLNSADAVVSVPEFDEPDGVSFMAASVRPSSTRAGTISSASLVFNDHQTLLSITENISVYRELKRLYEGTPIVAGQKVLQKKIRKILRKTERATTGIIGGWEEVHRRWKIIISTSGGTLTEDRGERQNYTGFLCTLGGICLKSSMALPGQVPEQRSRGLSQPQASAFYNTAVPPMPNYPRSAMEPLDDGVSEFSAAYGQSSRPAIQNARATMEQFVADLVNLMVCDNIVIREYVKDLLGNDITEGLFDILFTYCERSVIRLMNTDMATVNVDRNMFFVDSFISVLKMILDRTNEDNVVQEDDFTSMTGSFDLGTLVLSFVQFINGIMPTPANIQTILRMKVKLSQLSEVIVVQRERISLRQDIRFRNRMLDALIQWNSEASTIHDSDGDIANMKLTRDLVLSSMKALVSVLVGLPLQPSTEAVAGMQVEALPQADDELDAYETTNQFKGKQFYKYLNFFLQVLQKVKVKEDMEMKNLEHSSMTTPESQVIVNRAKDALHHLGLLKEYSVLSLSNLLASNIDVGLRYSLSMGYHEDPRTRTAFMQVLTNLLETGAKEQFEGLGDEGQIMQARYERLVDMLMDKDYTIPLSLGEVNDSEDTASVLMSVFEAKDKTVQLLASLLEHEVNQTDYASNLFRRNSMATRLLSVFAKTSGKDYLTAALKPVIDELLSFKPTLTFEIDPVKLSEYDDPTINLKNLKMLVKRLLDNIVGTQSMLPPSLKQVCFHIASIVGKHFPDARITSVGAFIFLRFICPVIVAPEAFNIAPPIQDKEIKRGLVLATKVIQNLANNVLFGSKEAYMVDLNDLLKKNIGRVHGFLKSISEQEVVDTTPITQPSAEKTSKAAISEYDLLRLHRVLALNIDKMENANLALPHGTSQSDMAKYAASRKVTFKSLSTLLAHLGPPPDLRRIRLALLSKEQLPRTSLPPVAVSQMYHDFITRVQSRPGYETGIQLLAERNFFFEGYSSITGRTVLYYIARRVQPNALDMELLLFLLLTASKSISQRQFDIVVDASFFTVDNEWDLDWVRRFQELVSLNVTQNLGKVIVFNCNTAFRKFIMRCSRVLEGSASKTFVFVSSVSELQQLIPLKELKLPKSAFAAEKEIIETFSPVNRITNLREYVPVMLKIAADKIHISYVNLHDVLGSRVVIADVYRYSDIEDVMPSQTEDGVFVIKYAEKVRGLYGTGTHGTSSLSTMTFWSPKCQFIVQAIRSAQASYKKSRPQHIVADERYLRPGDVAGTLLNMALLNLGSPDSNLRLASYNLMHALASNFSFKVGNQMLSARVTGLCIPSFNQGFVLSISEYLAEHEQHLTLEFLIECILGFNKSKRAQKHFCIQYMTPWLKNLSTFARQIEPIGGSLEGDSVTSQDALQKMRSVLKLLIDMTIKEEEMFPVIQTKIWCTLSAMDELHPFIVEAFLQASVENGLGSWETEVLSNTMVTLATLKREQIANLVIDRLTHLILDNSAAVEYMVHKKSWPEIAVLLRFILMLSFNNLLDVKSNLAKLFDLIVILVAHGRPLIRSTIHGITVNVIHSLCTLDGVDDASLDALKQVLSDMSDPKVCTHFGLSGSSMIHQHFGSAGMELMGGRKDGFWAPNTSHSAFLFTSETLAGECQWNIQPKSLKVIVEKLLHVMSTGAGDLDLAAEWKAKWMSLTMNNAFKPNLALQPRAFVALGVIASEMDHDSAEFDALLGQILVSLYAHLTIYDPENPTVLLSIITCITDLIAGFESAEPTLSNSRISLLLSIFWVAVGLIQLSDPHIFLVTLSLLTHALRILESNGVFSTNGMSPVLSAHRESRFSDQATALDSSYGVWFSADFSFAFSAHMMKGLKHASAKQPSIEALMTILEISGRAYTQMRNGNGSNNDVDIGGMVDYVNDHCIGFVIPLLPVYRDIPHLLRLSGLPDHLAELDLEHAPALPGSLDNGGSKFRQVLDRLTPLSDENRAMLMITILIALLESNDCSDSEAAFIYGMIAEITLESPELISMV